ncbi:MAG TPA: hypothetical protein VFM69_07795, partial [Pricia sp.]|nr:hypothetical protein [Pricia sp.]
MRNKTAWLFGAIILVVNSGYGQISSDYRQYQEQYPNSQSIRLNQETVLTIGLDDGQFDITQESLT